MISDILRHNKSECERFISKLESTIDYQSNRWALFRNDQEISICKSSIIDFRRMLNETESFAILLSHISSTVSEINYISNYILRNRSKIQSYHSSFVAGGSSVYHDLNSYKDFYFKKVEKAEALAYLIIAYNTAVTNFYAIKTNGYYRSLNLKTISFIDKITSGTGYLNSSKPSNFIASAIEGIYVRNDTDVDLFYQLYRDKEYKIKMENGNLHARSKKHFNLGRRYLNIIAVDGKSGSTNKVDGYHGTLKSGYSYKFVLTSSKRKIVLVSD